MVIIKKYYKIELYDILAVPKLNNMARAYSTLVVLVSYMKDITFLNIMHKLKISF